MDQYIGQKAEFVEIRGKESWLESRALYTADMLDLTGGIVRHDSRKLAALIERIIFPDP